MSSLHRYDVDNVFQGFFPQEQRFALVFLFKASSLLSLYYSQFCDSLPEQQKLDSASGTQKRNMSPDAWVVISLSISATFASLSLFFIFSFFKQSKAYFVKNKTKEVS